MKITKGPLLIAMMTGNPLVAAAISMLENGTISSPLNIRTPNLTLEIDEIDETVDITMTCGKGLISYYSDRNSAIEEVTTPEMGYADTEHLKARKGVTMRTYLNNGRDMTKTLLSMTRGDVGLAHQIQDLPITKPRRDGLTPSKDRLTGTIWKN